MKKVLTSLFLVMTFLGVMYFNPMNALAAEVTGSGSCGDNITWVAYSDGNLIISGEGEMDDYSYKDMNFAEWFVPSVTIKKVTIEEGVTSIGDYAFYNCDQITAINIPQSVNEIGIYAFNLCSALERLELPSNLKTISDGMFSKCENLREIVIPEGVTTIGAWSFSNCKKIENINLPDSLLRIGESAFANCDSMIKMNIPCNVSEIEGGAFSGCDSLISIEVDEGNLNYCNDEKGILFSKDKTELVTALLTISGKYEIPEGVKIIADGAFSSCLGLTGIIIPEGVECIGKNAFVSCYGITQVEFPSTLKTVGSGAFKYCKGLTEISIPGNITDFSDAFSYCSNLKSIEICEGVTEISSGAFHMCENLENVTIPSTVITIDSYAFQDCEKLQTVVLPDNLITIGMYAFANSGLTAITLPSQVKYIRDGAFRETLLTEIIIPDSVTTIDGAFWKCTSLENVVIGTGITEITNHTFSYCSNLENIIIPENVTSIYPYAFRNSGLTSITIPKSITSIGTYAFAECVNMNSIYFEGDAPTFGTMAFKGLIATLYYPMSNETWTTDIMQDYAGTIAWEAYRKEIASGTCGDDLTWILYEDGCLEIMGTGEMSSYSSGSKAPWYTYKNSITDVKIADGVTEIGSYAFYQCSELESVEIPDSVQFVGQYAFYQCNKVNNITIPEGVASIRQFTFYGCKALRNLTLPNTIEYIDQYAFGECQFGDFVVPEGVTRIYAWAFYMANWDSLVLPESLTLMGEYIFSNAAGNKGIITTPVSVKSIPSGAYAMCGNMTSIKIADGVTTIGNNAFRYCGNLKEIWIPESVTSISSGAFYGLKPEKITMYGYAGSYAEKYATTYGFDFVTVEDFVIVTQPTDQTVAVGQNAMFSVEATGSGLTYQWQYSTDGGENWKDSEDLNCNTATLSVEALEEYNGYQYRCVLRDEIGNTLNTEVAILTVEVKPDESETIVIIGQPRNYIGQVNDDVVFAVSAEGEDLKYEWFYSKDGGETFEKTWTSGYNTNTLTPILRWNRDEQQFYCVVTDKHGNSVQSDTVKMSVETSDVTIITQPVSVQNGCEGTLYHFTVEAEGINIEYRWYYSMDGGETWQESWIDGFNTNTLNIRMNQNRSGWLFRCAVTSGLKNTVNSDEVLFQMQAPSVGLTGHPENVVAAPGEMATFNVTATGNDLTYLWYVSTDKSEWTQTWLDGYNTATLSFPSNENRAGKYYKCIVKDGSGTVATSKAAALVLALPEVISQPTEQTLKVGETVTFAVEATGTKLSYLWYASTDGGESWTQTWLDGYNTNTLSFNVTTGRAGKMYKCVVTDMAGNVVESDGAMLNLTQ